MLRSGPALTDGAWLAGGATSTVIVMSSDAETAPSSAVSRRIYVPAAEKVAVVSTADALSNVTVPGPLTNVHSVATAPGGFGSPSSVTVPSRAADDGWT